MLPGLNCCQNGKNRFCFNSDTGLRLIVERTLQTTVVKVNAHRSIRLLLYASLDITTKLTCPAEETDSTKIPARQHRFRLSALLGVLAIEGASFDLSVGIAFV